MDKLYSIVCEVNTYGKTKFALVNTTADKNNLPAKRQKR